MVPLLDRIDSILEKCIKNLEEKVENSSLTITKEIKRETRA